MSDAAEARGDLALALSHGGRLLATRPGAAEEQAREILKAFPGQRDASLLQIAALRRLARLNEALALALALNRAAPNFAPGWLETGRVHAAREEGPEAILALRRAVMADPALSDGWGELAERLASAGDAAGAAEARAQQVSAAIQDPRLLAAAGALHEGRIAPAEQLLRETLKARPTEVAAIRMLAEVAGRLGRYADAEKLLSRCLELAPEFDAARLNYALVLQRVGRPAEAVAETDRLLAKDPRNDAARGLRAASLVRVGEYDAAIEAYETLLRVHPTHAKIRMSYGHALKTVGRRDEAIAAYRMAVTHNPALGEAWWSLANLKTFRFTPDDLDVMRGELQRTDLDDEDRFHLHYALGKALEDAEAWGDSFDHYAQGAAIRRSRLAYDADEISDQVRRARTLMDPSFFAARAGGGCPSDDPIFVVGLPRSGSTLVEQILASHSLVEGTMELGDIMSIATRLGGKHARGEASLYPEILAGLTPAELAALGEEYLERTRVQRKTDRPRFIDKMPNNWAHIGLIQLILPNAAIIDVRRHPLACGFSCFKQHFARGQEFSYDLGDIGRFYADYVALTAHVDATLPGRVHRVIYEDLIANPRGEVERLLAYCGLDFEEGCMEFHRNERAVRTASSEQVRQPIYVDALDHWRHYAPWLGPLEAALGPVLQHWRITATPV